MSLIKDVYSDLQKIDQGPGVMRKFGVLLSALLAIFGGIVLWKHRHEADMFTQAVIGFWTLGGITLLLALIQPRWLKPLNTVMVFIAMIIGWIMTRVILIVLYYTIFTLFRCVLAIIGKDSLRLKLDPAVESYWIKRESKPFDPGRCRRLF